MPALLPRVYHPHAKVVLQTTFDGQVPSDPGTPTPTMPAIPTRVQVLRNDARHADTCELELGYRDFPFDARILKDVLFTVHIADMVKGGVPLLPSPANLRFVGLVDEVHTEYGGDGNVVRLKARDYTGVYLDYPWTQRIPIAGGLQAAVEFVRSKVTPLTRPAVFLDPSAATANLSKRRGKPFYSPKGKRQNAWGALSDLCGEFGLVPVWELDQLVIRSASQVGTGFWPLVYGEHIERLRLKKNLREPNSRPVKVVSWDGSKGVAITAQFPPQPTRTKAKPNAGRIASAAPERGAETYHVAGALTVPDATLLATRLYNERSLRQFSGKLNTREMADALGLEPGGLLRAKNGDTLDVQISPTLRRDLQGLDPAQQMARLTDLRRPHPMDAATAQALVQSWAKAQTLTTSFYVKSARHMWSVDDGYELEVEFMSFLLG